MEGVPDWMLGQMLAAVGSITASLGLIFMKQSADLEVGLPIYKKWRWFLGFACMIFNGAILDPAMFALAPLSMIAPLAGLTIVVSCLLACCFRKEALSAHDIASIVVVLAGVTAVSTFGPHPQSEPPLSQMILFAQNPLFAAFAAVSLAAAAADLLLMSGSPRFARCRPSPTSFAWTLFAAYAAASCGGLTQISLKIVATGLRAAIGAGGIAPLLTPVIPIAVVGLAACAPLQLYLLNATLSSSPVKYAVPVYQALLILLSTAAGGVFFMEFAHSSAASLLGFFAGIATTIAGIAALSSAGAAPGGGRAAAIGDSDTKPLAAAHAATHAAPACAKAVGSPSTAYHKVGAPSRF